MLCLKNCKIYNKFLDLLLLFIIFPNNTEISEVLRGGNVNERKSKMRQKQ